MKNFLYGILVFVVLLASVWFEGWVVSRVKVDVWGTYGFAWVVTRVFIIFGPAVFLIGVWIAKDWDK